MVTSEFEYWLELILSWSPPLPAPLQLSSYSEFSQLHSFQPIEISTVF